MKKQREISDRDIGKCPYCESKNYTRDLEDMDDDAGFYICECQDCHKEFKETFRLSGFLKFQ